MNYGDGWYGGVYVAAMYALAYYSDDVEFVVTEALRTIPAESQCYQCINDVIGWCGEFPGDWKRTWFETQRKWSSDIGCPDGVFDAFNIDAKINAAYIVIGLLYGEGDYGSTLEISTRCGQDSDCNPASAGGILGTMIGYDAIPDKWKAGLDRVDDMDLKYTTLSLNEVYDMSYQGLFTGSARGKARPGGTERGFIRLSWNRIRAAGVCRQIGRGDPGEGPDGGGLPGRGADGEGGAAHQFSVQAARDHMEIPHPRGRPPGQAGLEQS